MYSSRQTCQIAGTEFGLLIEYRLLHLYETSIWEVYDQCQITVSPGPAEMAVFQWARSCNNMRSALSSNDGRLSWISRRITLMKPARNWMLKSSYHKANLSCKIRTGFIPFYYFVPKTVISLQSAKSSTRDWRDERASLIIKKNIKINKEQNRAVIPIIKNSANISFLTNWEWDKAVIQKNSPAITTQIMQ